MPYRSPNYVKYSLKNGSILDILDTTRCLHYTDKSNAYNNRGLHFICLNINSLSKIKKLHFIANLLMPPLQTFENLKLMLQCKKKRLVLISKKLCDVIETDLSFFYQSFQEKYLSNFTTTLKA